MKLNVLVGELVTTETDALIIGIYEDMPLEGEIMQLDLAGGGFISKTLAVGELKGKLNETLVLYPQGIAARKVVVVGLGPKSKLSTEKIRQAAGSAAKVSSKGKTKSLACPLFGGELSLAHPAEAAEAMVEGILMSLYHYEGLKSKKQENAIIEIAIVEPDTSRLGLIENGAKKGEIIARATNLARDMVNAPANHMTPTHMAQIALDIAHKHHLKYHIMDRADIQGHGMGAFLGVAQGSAEPPKFIVLSYERNPGGETLAFVGKGLTFDSGGISIKPSENMHYMKNDMAGGAAVIASMQAIAELRPKTNVLAVVPATENLPSGTALKPGDVLTAMTGKTIEIINTDAEGRLILADAVAYAAKYGATKIIDIATLTGACGVALGNVYSAIVANNDDLVAEIQKAASVSGERFWQMPGDDDYLEMIKSPVADIKNSGGRNAGVMTGGLFIGQFVGDKPWAHLDIAPTAYTESEKHYQPKGATGVATRTLIALACNQNSSD